MICSIISFRVSLLTLLDGGIGMIGGADVSNATLGANDTDDNRLLDASTSNNCLASESMALGDECLNWNRNSTGDCMYSYGPITLLVFITKCRSQRMIPDSDAPPSILPPPRYVMYRKGILIIPRDE